MQDFAAVLPSVSAHDDVRGGFDVSRLLGPTQALDAYFASVAFAAPAIERVPLVEAFGRVLASDATADADHPNHPRSTMDGYAIASAAGTVARRVVGEVLMGAPPPGAIAFGEAMRIPTGGALPDGADAVVPQEDVALDRETIAPREAVAAGDSITPRAADMRAGERILRAGRRIGAPELGVLATLGCDVVATYRRPRIAIVSTGDELVDPARATGVGQVRDSNRYAIAGTLLALGAVPVHEPRAADTLDALRHALRNALATCDAVVLTGGSSVGIRDLVPRVVAELGEPGAIVHGLRVKPGKPTLLAAVGSKPVIGLPGNPTSSLTILEAIVAPIVIALAGETRRVPAPLFATAAAPFVGRDAWTWYVPVRVVSRAGALFAEPLVLRSAFTSLLARASGYAIVGERPSRIEIGESVAVHRFSSGGAPIEAA